MTYIQLKPGRGGEIRTPDILVPNQARYQATLHPEELRILRGCDEKVNTYLQYYVLSELLDGVISTH